MRGEHAGVRGGRPGAAGACGVEPGGATIHIRDSKDTTRPHLGPAAWAAFVVHAAAQAG
ncbi:DUF397 domain-containing protein [Streptomyces sp. NPDC014892]|uniref:DUF397 domain-containing protein n=1 Tax=Streptomyces sp. NPDC014892 TaxID=3364930 RepID=UPI0036FE996F